MEYKQIDINDVSFLKTIIGSKFVFTDEENLLIYSKDETEDLLYPPEIVAKPKTTNEVAKIMIY